MSESNLTPNYFYTSDQTRIFYKINKNFKTSKLPVLVFNYGLVCNIAHWREQINYFDGLGYPILVHDYRGHYSSSGQDQLENVTFEFLARDLNELLEDLKVESTIQLGHSMGVNVTLEFAKTYPEKIKGMVLISGTVVPPQDVMFDTNIVEVVEPYVHWVAKKFPDLHEKIWQTGFLNPLARKVIFEGGFNTKTVSEEFVQLYMKKISELPKDIFFHLLTEMKRHDILSYLETIKTPSLVMGGDQDKVIPNYLQLILNKYLPKSELYIIKDGSHVPQMDFPKSVNERILFFLKKAQSNQG
jgi:non-heme chloroperoxidase